MSNSGEAAGQQTDPTAWGQDVTDERKGELDGLAERQRTWAEQPEATRGDSPFKSIALTGADVFWLAKRALAGPDGDAEAVNITPRVDGIHLDVSLLHLEGANLNVANLEGADLTLAHLEGASLMWTHLEGASLMWTHLEGANLSAAELEEANLGAAHLERADLTLAHLEGAILNYSWFTSTTVLTGAVLDDRTQLGDIHWNGVGTVDLTQLTWDQAPRLGDERGVGLRASVESHASVVRAYRQLAAQLRAQGMTDVADRFSYRAQFRQRYLYLRALLEDWRRPWRWPGDLLRYVGSAVLAVLAGYGYRPRRTIALYLVFIALFAAMYFAYGTGCHIASPQDLALILAKQIPHGYSCVTPAEQPMTWNEAFVVSFTAFHGRGFLATTIKPGDSQAALAAAEAVLGLIIEISFIATFTQRFFGSK